MPKLARLLRHDGKLLILYMAWLPFEDTIAGKGLTLTGKHTDTLSQDDYQRKLTYTVGAKNVSTATLAGDIAWVDGGTHYTNPTTKGYTFSDTTEVKIDGTKYQLVREEDLLGVIEK